MDDFISLLEGGASSAPDYTLSSMGLSLLLAFVIGQLIAWVYVGTHNGLSYSRNFTQSLVLLTMVVALVMYVIGNSIVTAFGLIGALAIIRFRNVLKDTRDTTFIFFALVLGMALGSQRYMVAVFGAVSLLLVTIYLRVIGFGSRGHYDGHLTCGLDEGEGEAGAGGAGLRAELHRHCRGLKCISERRARDVTEFVYQVRLRDRRRGAELVSDLHSIAGVHGVSLVLRDELAEV
jgi:hypothetical protein